MLEELEKTAECERGFHSRARLRSMDIKNWLSSHIQTVTPASVSRSMRRLREEGLVERKRVRERRLNGHYRRRSYYWYLTSPGVAKAKETKQNIALQIVELLKIVELFPVVLLSEIDELLAGEQALFFQYLHEEIAAWRRMVGYC